MIAGGLRLDALEADAAAVQSLARAVDDGLHIARDALRVVRDGWDGVAGSAAADDVDRHCVAAAGVAENLRATADELRSLREQLAQLVTPYGGTDTDSIDAAYDDALVRMNDRPAVAPSMPPPQQATAAVPPQSAVESPPASAPWGSGLPVPALPSLPNLGGSLPTLVAQIADLLGSYADAAPDPVSDPPDAPDDGPARESPKENPEDPLPQPLSTPPGSFEPAPVPAAVAEVPPAAVVAPEPSPPAAAAPSSPVQSPPLLAAEIPPVEAAADARTPCAIAADELPQVGR